MDTFPESWIDPHLLSFSKLGIKYTLIEGYGRYLNLFKIMISHCLGMYNCEVG